MMKSVLLLLVIGVFTLCVGCISTDNKVDARVETVHEIKPVHITVDLNIRVQNALDDFFKDVDQPVTEPDVPVSDDDSENSDS